jgi:hypothetical protein
MHMRDTNGKLFTCDFFCNVLFAKRTIVWLIIIVILGDQYNSIIVVWNIVAVVSFWYTSMWQNLDHLIKIIVMVLRTQK